ncbi:hypothetical protein AB1M41_02125 [Bacillus inaquosorum]|uniref:hypothetical protein n=1 Tax=Bacillus inaquosorum TaxID=483913 RepID=UPI0034CF4C46
MGMKEKTNVKETGGLYIFGPSNRTEGKDLTPTIRLLEEKIKKMERNAEYLKQSVLCW